MSNIVYFPQAKAFAIFDQDDSPLSAIAGLPHHGDRRFIDCNEDPKDRIAREYMDLTDESFEITRRMCRLVERQAQITERMSQLRIEHDEI